MSLRVRTQPAAVRANRELISQALANLVENAIKYGKPVAQAQGSVVSLDAKQILIEARREADKVLLSVTDHGIGIPEGDRRHAEFRCRDR